jgi:hypothetical protein
MGKMRGDIPITWQDALAGWDSGELVFTIELGGIGPSYEQAMHIAVFETLRSIGDMDTTLHADTQTRIIDRAIRDADETKDLQLSSAQAAAVRGFVHTVLNHGWQNSVLRYDTDRRIQVRKWFPG